MESVNYAEWEIEETCEWLGSLGLSKYEEAFRENDITGSLLPDLTHDLLTEIGVKAVGHRLKLLKAIKEMPNSQEAAQNPGTDGKQPLVGNSAGEVEPTINDETVEAEPISTEILSKDGDYSTFNSLQSLSATDMIFLDVDYKGWLTKEGAKIKSWKKRYFVLKDMVLTYYTDDSARVCKGKIIVPSYKCEKTKPNKEENMEFHFQLTHPGMRTYNMFADTAEEREDWIYAIENRGLATATTQSTVKPPEPEEPLKADLYVARTFDERRLSELNLRSKGPPPLSPSRNPQGLEFKPERPPKPPELQKPSKPAPRPQEDKPEPKESRQNNRVVAEKPVSKARPVLEKGQRKVDSVNAEPRESSPRRNVTRANNVSEKSSSAKKFVSEEDQIANILELQLAGGDSSDEDSDRGDQAMGSNIVLSKPEKAAPTGPPKLVKQRTLPTLGIDGAPRTNSPPASPPPIRRNTEASPRDRDQKREASNLTKKSQVVKRQKKYPLKSQPPKDMVVSWMNGHLAGRNMGIVNPEDDLCDGVILINLLEILAKQSFGDYCEDPVTEEDKISNLQHVQKILLHLEIRISVRIKDVVSGKLMPILRLCLGINAFFSKPGNMKN